jgi:hypothetical protein
MIIRPPPKLTSKASAVKYLEVDLWSWLKDLSNGLLKIDFKQNFQSFIVTDISIPAGMEVPITNQFQSSYSGVIPSGRIIIRQTGDANIIDGDTEWTSTQLYLKNPSANDAVVTVLFFL